MNERMRGYFGLWKNRSVACLRNNALVLLIFCLPGYSFFEFNKILTCVQQ